MRPLARVLIDESHRQAWSTRPEVAAVMNPVNPADASYAVAAGAAERAGLEVTVHAEGALDDAALAGIDVLVLPHAADDAWEHTTGVGSPRLAADELDAIDRFVHAGGGLVILAETEQAKYGNNFADLAARFGIAIDSTTVQDPTHAFKDVPTWVARRPRARTEARPHGAGLPGLLLPRGHAARRRGQRRPRSRDRRAHEHERRSVGRRPGHVVDPDRRPGRRHVRLRPVRRRLDHRPRPPAALAEPRHLGCRQPRSPRPAGAAPSRPGSPTTPRGPTWSTRSSRCGRCRPRTARSTSP